MSWPQCTGYDIKQIVDVARASPGTGGGDGGGVGEGWVETVEVPVQTAEAAGDDGEGAAGAAGAGVADYGVAFCVFEAEEVDCFFLLSGRWLVWVDRKEGGELTSLEGCPLRTRPLVRCEHLQTSLGLRRGGGRRRGCASRQAW